jgi:hypothetical protein
MLLHIRPRHRPLLFFLTPSVLALARLSERSNLREGILDIRLRKSLPVVALKLRGMFEGVMGCCKCSCACSEEVT